MTHRPAIYQMLQTLIAATSVSSTHNELDQSNRTVVEALANWLDDLGFQIELQQLPNQIDKLNLIARYGEGSDGLVFSGHTDTVPYDEYLWDSDPLALYESENKFHGLGSTDMKGFFAALLQAFGSVDLKRLRKPLVVLATADEESTMSGARFLQQQGRSLGRYCIIGEPTGLRPVHQHKGVFMEEVRLSGQSGHSSHPALGNNALDGMHQVISFLLEERKKLAAAFHCNDFIVPIPTLNLGHIHGGDNANRICGDCSLHYDLRLLPGMDLNGIRSTLRNRILDIATSLELTCEFSSLFDGVPALSSPVDTELVQQAQQITGQPSQSVTFATEGPYLQSLNMQTIILGPGDIAVAHRPNEFVSHADLLDASAIYTRFIERNCL